MPEPPLSTDDKPAFDALRAAGVDPDLAYLAVQRIRDMAAANVKDRLDTFTHATRRVFTLVMFVIVVLTSMVIGIATVVFSPSGGPVTPGQSSAERLPSAPTSGAEADPAAR